MPVCSYVVYPVRGRKDALKEELSALPGCEVTPAENAELLVLVTDTADDRQEEAMQSKLRSLPDIQCLNLTFGQVEHKENVEQDHAE